MKLDANHYRHEAKRLFAEAMELADWQHDKRDDNNKLDTVVVRELMAKAAVAMVELAKLNRR